jgi:predicted nucleic acid-binding protein
MNRNDRAHSACEEAYLRERLIYLPQTTLTEVAYLLRREAGALSVASFLVRLPYTKFVVAALEPVDIQRTAELLRVYVDSRVDFVDASIAAFAERLGITRLLTLDRRDFQIIRPAHTNSFELFP